MSDLPAVSIVVPAYNVAPYLTACLESLSAQTLQDWECIVVDDGSSDTTAETARLFADLRVTVFQQPNGGVSAARNAGLARARGATVMFLDGDDYLHPTALQRLHATLEADPSLCAAFGTVWRVLEDGRDDLPQRPVAQHTFPSGDLLLRIISKNFFANGGQVLIRSAYAHRAGGFNAALRLSEDWEYWCRLAALGPIRFSGPSPAVLYLRLRSDSAGRSLAKDWANYEPSISAVLGNEELRKRFHPAAWRKLGRRVMASHLWECGRVNFVARRFGPARAMMVRALAANPNRPRRWAYFALAQASQLLNRSLTSRFRFQSDTARAP